MADDLDQRPRVVLDTNVLSQAIPTKSRFRLIIEALEQNLFVLILSNEILLEYEVRVSRAKDDSCSDESQARQH